MKLWVLCSQTTF